MTAPTFPLAKQVGRVPSMTIPLDGEQQRRFDRLMERIVMIDMHEHPLVFPENMDDLTEYLRSKAWGWGYDAVRAGGWKAVATGNILTCLGTNAEPSKATFADLVDEIGIMRADIVKNGLAKGVVIVGSADDIVRAKERGEVGFLPTAEHLAIGSDLHRLDVLYGLGIRIGGLTYTRLNAIGDGQTERTNAGLSEFGLEVVKRMNELGIVIDVSHCGTQTALDAISHSQVPIVFSHNAAATLWPTKRTRSDAELRACAERGGLVCVTAVPNSLSDDPKQDINCVLDHYDYLVKLLGAAHVGIGTDTLVGDHVGLHVQLLGRDAPHKPASPYLNGLESPADGKNIIRGLIVRGYSDTDITMIAGQNALELFRRAMR